MEIVLLWLDDLDDLLFSTALAWARLRRTLLKVGLAAAVALALAESSSAAMHLAPALAAVASAAVGGWLLGAAARVCYRRDLRGALGAT